MRMKGYLSACMAVVITLTASLPVYGAKEPGITSDVPDEMTEETWNRLNDQTIEFDELPDLIRYFNPDVVNAFDTGEITLRNTEYIYEEMKKYSRDLKDNAKDIEDSGTINTTEGMARYNALKGAAKELDKGAVTVKDSLKRIDSYIKKGTDPLLKNVSSAADQLMIGYNSALANRAVVQKALDLSVAAYEAQCLSLNQGLATEADVLAANKGILEARASLEQLDNTIDGLKRSLCLMTGYPADGEVQIGGIPMLDSSDISKLDLTADTTKAINNNYELIGIRHEKSRGGTGMKSKDDRISEASQNITVTMQSYYQEILRDKTAYDAACTSYEKAVLEKNKAERSYQLGMISKIGYLHAQMAFAQAEGEKQSAYNTLFQAYRTYQWAVEGIISPSGQ